MISGATKGHIEYHLTELSKHCDSRIEKITTFWAGDNLTTVIIQYPRLIYREVDTIGLRLSEALAKVMEAL